MRYKLKITFFPKPLFPRSTDGRPAVGSERKAFENRLKMVGKVSNLEYI